MKGNLQKAQPTILIVDDDPLVCRLLEIRLKSLGFPNITSVNEGRVAIEVILSRHPDIVLLDITIPDIDGLEVLNVVKAASSGTRVLMLTAHENPGYLTKAIALGASGYIVKRPPTLKSLGETVRLALEGDATIVDQELLVEAAKLAQSSKDEFSAPSPPSISDLTPQEREVLNLITKGLSNDEIGTSLHISLNTVKTHVSSILQKLQVSDRTQAAIFALRQGL